MKLTTNQTLAEQYLANWWKTGFTVGLLVLCSALLFARLGHYAFWCDESQTALAAKGILRTGETTALV
ncbi:MAG: hypothetical protein RMK20_12985, partial [Verrucomicrobiales bacterium]|nr:hypothetical protein [Verrucomicrobiales bacterium]